MKRYTGNLVIELEDQNTGNVETVCLLSNTRKKPYVTLDVDMDDDYRIKAEGRAAGK